MKIGFLKESLEHEYRVAITPDIASSYIKKGLEVLVEKNAGIKAGISDEDYHKEGCLIASKDETLKSNIIVKVNAPNEYEVSKLTFQQKILAHMKILDNKELLDNLLSNNIEAYALELMPRISRAQSMDILSSQSNLVGYQAVIHSAYHSKIIFPMMMTSSGTIVPAKVFIIGVGVAGLQAIATAKRMGCIVTAYDVRAETKEQVESLGAKFISVMDKVQLESSFYTKEMIPEYKLKEREILLNHVAKQDIIITTALIMGKKSPILIDKEMFQVLKKGSTIVDLAIENGGNCVGAKLNEIVEIDGIKIIGELLINYVARQASFLFAKNIYNFLSLSFNDTTKELNFNYEDDLIKGTLITKGGKTTHSLLSKT